MMKKEFDLHDIVVVGVVNTAHADGVFNVESLGRIFELEQFIRTLKWPDPHDPSRQAGLVEANLISPSVVDNIEQGGLGVVRFDWLMPEPPTSREAALAVRQRAKRIPLLDGTLVSEDGKAISLYLPISDKDVSYRMRAALLEKIEAWQGSDDQFHITGLPVAEETFGVEMFIQMAIAAPAAMLVIFALLWWFFRNFLLILSPMIVAMVCTISTMGVLVTGGHTIHIMSSMIPIFIMPIAVLDSVHILSEFFDRYRETRDRRQTMLAVMDELFSPMLFTTITTAVAFASLALTPIPPVQVFGVHVALGVILAWLWTITFIPAFVMLIPERRFANFGHAARHEDTDSSSMSRILLGLGSVAFTHASKILVATALVVVIAGYGISKIVINDNPVNWFWESHPIRVADRELNEHFGGTYMAYLELEPAGREVTVSAYETELAARVAKRQADAETGGIAHAGSVYDALAQAVREQAGASPSKPALLENLVRFAEAQADAAPSDQFEAWDDALLFLDEERQRDEVFKQPDLLRYIAALQDHMATTGIVGKSNSLTDIVKTVHRELLLGEDGEFRVPDTANAVAQTLLTFQNSHRPHDLWLFVTPDYRRTVIWVQLKSGDNRDMTAVTRAVADYMAAQPPPSGLSANWFGSTYINVVWQEKMVSGMLTAFLGSFGVVLLMMWFLFRSVLWGLLSMIPLTVAVGFIYGVIGLVGKDYDMPVAVLSALSLGLAIDYAIHFCARSRSLYREFGSWSAAEKAVFGEPARAITRNAIVLALGFLPLWVAPLTPYNTVGILIAAILVTAGVATLAILPALITVFERRLFPAPREAPAS